MAVVDPRLEDANLRYADAAVIEKRVKERRKHDRVRTWLLLVWLTLATVFWVGAIVALVNQGDDIRHVVREQQSGRSIAIDTLCASVSGVVDAGRATIGHSAVGSKRFRHNLERLGFPEQKLRERQAKAAARAYGLSIARRVEQATGRKGLARPDGTLDCSQLRRAASAP